MPQNPLFENNRSEAAAYLASVEVIPNNLCKAASHRHAELVPAAGIGAISEKIDHDRHMPLMCRAYHRTCEDKRVVPALLGSRFG